MTPAVLQPRIPDAIPIEVDPPRIYNLPPRPMEVPPAEGGGTNLKPISYLRYRWATVVFLGGLLASVFAFTAYSFIPAKYTTYSIIRVSPQDPRIYYNEDPHGRGDFASYMKTQAGVLRSHFVLTAALRDPEVAALPMLKAQDDPVRYLEEELQIETADGSELIKPKLSGDDARAIALIVNAIHDAFFSEVVEAERKRKQIRLKQIEDGITQMQQDLEKKQPPPAKGPDQPAESLPGVGPSLAASQVARLREKLDAAEVRQKQLEDEKRRLIGKRDHPESALPPVPAGFVASLEGDPGIAAINRQVALWQKQLKYLADLSGDKDNPAVKELNKKIDEAAQDRERVRKERIEEFQKSQLQEVVRKLEADEEKINVELASLKIMQEQTRGEMKEYEAKLSKILPDVEGPKDFNKVDTRNRSEIISGMMEKANLLRLELSAPTRVQSLQKAAVPMKRDIKKQLMGTVAAGLIGFLLVGLGVVGYEARVRRTMSVADVQKATLGPILGAIPAIRTATGEPTPEMALAEEAIEKTRANLMQQFARPGGKVVMITSALMDEGRTFLARELSLSFARAGGQTLLVDFDLRMPMLHEMFEADNDVGVCELLTGEADVPTAAKILPCGISLLSAGKWSDVVRQYLSPTCISEMLGELRARFDFVIVNAHPILSVAETSLAGRAADAVLLTVEKYESRLPLVSRAQEKIAALTPEAFGVVVLGASRDECLQ
jgi:capsular exopolysaccharide synthesis family protein